MVAGFDMSFHYNFPQDFQDEQGYNCLHQKIDGCWALILDHSLDQSDRMFKALCFLMAIWNHDALLSPASKQALAEVEDFPDACGKCFDNLNTKELRQMESNLCLFLGSCPSH